MKELNGFEELTIYVNKMVDQFPEFKDMIHDHLELCNINIEDGVNPIEAIKITIRDITSLTGVPDIP